MKDYQVVFDITVSYTMYVQADNEKQAREIAREKMEQDPMYYAKHMSHVVKHDIIDVVDYND